MSIFHIAEQPVWNAAKTESTYRVASLNDEGFIHLSTRSQFVLTASRYYRGRTDLVLLEVDEVRLPDGALRYESSTNDELFPHLYAELPVNAVIRVHMFGPDDEGLFAVPSTVE